MDAIRRARIEASVWKALEIYDRLGEEEGMKLFMVINDLGNAPSPSALQKEARSIFSILTRYFEDHNEVKSLISKFWSTDLQNLKILSVMLTGELARSDLKYLEIIKKYLGHETPEIQDAAQLALRAPLETEPEKTLKELSFWILEDHDFIRKAALESIRPYAEKIITITWLRENPQPLIKLLSKFKKNPSVKKEVACNLSDISRDHPQLVLETLKQWLKSDDDNIKWIASRVCRGLEKEFKDEVAQIVKLVGK